MGKTVYFLDSVLQQDGTYNVTYSASDINKIVQNLVGCGIAPFTSSSQYTTSDLNSLTEAVVASGASINGLKTSFSDNQITVSKGIGYFDNGATVVVDSEGVTVSYIPASKNYVYALFDESLNTCDFYSSVVIPSANTGQHILNIAEIAADGTVTDTRTFARAKIGTLGTNITYTVTPVENETRWYNDGELVYETNFDISKFNAVYIDFRPSSDTNTHLKRAFFDYSEESSRSFVFFNNSFLIAQLNQNKIELHYSGYNRRSMSCSYLSLKFF